MAKKYLLLLWLGLFPFLGGGSGAAQDDPSIHVNVVLVQLNVAITDSKGNYVSGLRPEDFSIRRGQHSGEDCHLRRGQRAHS